MSGTAGAAREPPTMVRTADVVAWCCPRCRGPLVDRPAGYRCTACAADYAVVGGIPDFRVEAPAWIDVAQDRELARELAAVAGERPADAAMVRDLVVRMFRGRDAMPAHVADLRARQVLDAPARLAPEVAGWLDRATRGRFLDLGCGPGMLLAAAARAGRDGVGVDVCLAWLVVAKAMVEAHGGRASLAAAFAEALPLAAGAVDGVVALDVVEHVADPVPFLVEIDRVTRDGGELALATPNRYSLAAEPHVFVWGVGWLPRRWQAAYVQWRTGRPYEYVRLLGAHELRRLVRRHTAFAPRLVVPPVPASEIARFAPRRARLARLYNRLAAAPLARPAALALGPFFRLVGRRAQAGAALRAP